MPSRETRSIGGSALRALAMLLAAAALAGGGFIAGRRSAAPAPDRDSSGVPAGGPAAGSGGEAGPRASSSLPVAEAVASDQAGWDARRWSDLAARPGSKARNQSLAALLEQLAETDPDRARALAQAEKNSVLRAELMTSVLRGWAHTAPAAAAQWVLAQSPDTDRSAAMAVIFAEVASQPDLAQRIAATVCQADPGAATSYGSSMIDALCEGGNFDAAAHFAQSGDGGVQQSIWLAEAFTKWSSYQPQEAAQAAEGLPDPAERLGALHGVVGGWSETDPAGLAQFLVQLPTGPDRTQMLGQAIRSWSAADPNAVSTWISSSSLGADSDGTAILASAMASVQPAQAAGWTQSIADPQQRSTTLLGVLQDWARTDPAAAKRYFDATPNLLPTDRDQAARFFQGP